MAPSCPERVRMAAATSAMSPMSIDAILASSMGSSSLPVATIDGTCRKYACMNSPARRCVNAIPEDSSRRSTSPCMRAYRKGEWRSGMMPESLTTCPTPACAAASMKFDWTSSIAGSAEEISMARSTPCSAWVSVAGRAMSPSTTSTSGRVASPSARVGLRTRARTGTPAADSRRTNAPPVSPVAPVTRIIVSRPRRRGAAGWPCCAPRRSLDLLDLESRASSGGGPRVRPRVVACRGQCEPRQVVRPSRGAAAPDLLRHAAVDQAQQGAVPVRGQRDLDHAAGGRRRRAVVLPFPGEHDAVGWIDLDVLAVCEGASPGHVHPEDAAGAGVELDTRGLPDDQLVGVGEVREHHVGAGGDADLADDLL